MININVVRSTPQVDTIKDVGPGQYFFFLTYNKGPNTNILYKKVCREGYSLDGYVAFVNTGGIYYYTSTHFNQHEAIVKVDPMSIKINIEVAI
jgi:hypothetical protein